MANFPGLIKRRGIFYYRLRVPGDVQAAFGRKEIWRSLDTADESQARQRIHKIAAAFIDEFEQTRMELAARRIELPNSPTAPSTTFYDVNAIARKHHQDVLDREEAKGIALFQLSTNDPKQFRRRVYVPSECVALLDFHYKESEVAKYESWLDYLYGEGDTEKVVAFIERKRLQGRLATIRKARAARNLGEFVALADQLAPGIGDAQRRQLIRALTDAELMALEKLSGEDDGYSTFAAVPVSSSITSSSAPLDMPFLSDVKRTFLEDKRRGGKSAGALEEQFKAIDDFLEIIGSKPIDAYGKKDVREYLDVIQSIPPNAQKKVEFRNLGLKGVSEKAKNLRSPGPNIKTTHKKFDAISALFKWLGRHYDHMPPNPFDGMRPQERANVRDERNPFTTDELKKIFSAPPYAGAQSRSRWLQPGNIILQDMGRYWLPLISLYTGCRLGEIMQMTKSDVKTEGAITYFDINLEGDKAVKTAASIRKIPIHPFLVERGLLDYVASLKMPDTRLINDIPLSGRPGDKSGRGSRMMAELLIKCGAKTSKNSFHSFRHNFEDACRDAEIDHGVMNALQGHIRGDMSDRYGNGKYALARLHAEVSKIEYKGFTLYS